MATIIKIIAAADLHRRKRLYKNLASAVGLHKPDIVALVGDFLHDGGEEPQLFSDADCALFLSRLDVPELVFVRGNHEDDAWLNFESAWRKMGRPLHALHGEVFLNGPIAITGFPCSLGVEDPFLGERPPLSDDAFEWFPNLLEVSRGAARTLWLMHEPPTGSPLAAKGDGPLSGNREWNKAIARFSPLLTVSGHDHSSPIRNGRWYRKIGRTVCVNVGQARSGPLHYSLVEAAFSSAKPSLPSTLRVTAFPWNQTIQCGPNVARVLRTSRARLNAV